MPKLNPLQVAIAAAVEGQIRPLEDRINALEEQLKNADARVAAAVEAAIAGLLAPVAKPAAEAGETIAECRHKNRMKKCTSCQARVKAEGGA